MICARWIPALAMAVSLPGLAAHAQSMQDFYSGKTLAVIVSSDPGGGYDAQARLMARHIGRFIPGHPTTIVQNMPGGGGILEANYIYNVAPQDGTVIGLVQRGVLTAQLTHQSGVRFEIAKFNWVGNLASENSVVISWYTSPVKTADDLFTKQLIVGSTGATSDSEMSPRLYNTLIGTKFKIISGYKGSTDVVLAMEKGELQGIADWAWSNIKTKGAQYLRDKRINLLLQTSLRRAPDLPNVPLGLDYVKNDTDRKTMELYLAQKTVARPVMAGPNLSTERAAALRKAFVDMSNDPQFKADAEKAKLEVDPSSGAAVEKVVALISSTPDNIAKRLEEAVNPKSSSSK
jgi:tripartite-type tricarboxylate transporter receptor subunit TctC